MTIANVSSPTFDFDFSRRMMFSFPFESVPSLIIDNSGAPAPVATNLPTVRLATGAIGANKTMEMAKTFSVQQGVAPNDILANVTDANAAGMWRRTIIFDTTLHIQSASGTLSATQRCGIGIGSFQAVPPDPAASANNVIRLYIRADTLTWELLVNRGDGITAPLITPLVGVPNAIINRSQRARIVYVPNQSITAIVDGITGCTVTSLLPLVPNTNAVPSYVSWFVTSGSSANSACRGAFTAAWVQVFQ